ncbi:hypothetical protein [Halobaculum sp. D14]|uniref:hypothetical protein n=1 Tax=unclassified Halobaculum TaxID=2640896 RepID=UPI003EB93B30
MLRYTPAFSSTDADTARPSTNLTVAVAVTAAFPVAMVLATYPAFTLGAAVGVVGSTALRR